jgi:hypothetical protein
MQGHHGPFLKLDPESTFTETAVTLVPISSTASDVAGTPVLPGVPTAGVDATLPVASMRATTAQLLKTNSEPPAPFNVTGAAVVVALTRTVLPPGMKAWRVAALASPATARTLANANA